MFRAGDQIGPYILISRIGRGAFGVVWLAERRTTITTIKVALKMPLDEDINLDAIRQEANLWVQASGHPNVSPIIEANIYHDQVVIVSEYAQDGSLDDWLRQYGGAAPSIEMAVEMASGILAGLQHLHSRQIIHRDLKPQNILLQGQTPRLADFGISRVLKSTSQSRVVAGTPVYMAPEAFDGKRNEQTDLWSVGVIFYQMLAGRLPFPQTDLTSLMGAILTRNPDPLPISVPAPLQEAIARALAKDTTQRYRSATEMRAALRNATQTIHRGHYAATVKEQAQYYTPTLPISEPKKSRAKVWLSTIGSILFAGAIIASRIATHYWNSTERASSTEPLPSAEQALKVEKDPVADARRWLAMLGHLENTQEVMRQTSAELASNPSNALALRARCSAYYLAHEEDRGRRDAEEVERLLANARSADEYEARCNARMRLKKLDLALDDCSRAIDLDPQYSWARFTRGAVYYEKKDYDRSISDYNRGLDLNPSHSLAYNNRGLALYLKQKYGSAIADFNKAIELDPQGAVAYVSRGIIYYAEQDYDHSLADDNKAIELDPRFAVAYANRGIIYYARQDYDRALADFNKAIELDPKNSNAYSSRGNVYDARQDYDRAIVDHSKAIELDPKNSKAYYDRGNDYYAMRDYDRALADHSKAIQLEPGNAGAYNNRGNDYYAMRDYDRAIIDYTRAIELSPQFAVAYGNRANAYEVTGDPQRAAADREKAQDLKK